MRSRVELLTTSRRLYGVAGSPRRRERAIRRRPHPRAWPSTAMTTTLDEMDSSRRAVREALAALNRGDETGASAIAKAHAARARPSRVRVLLLPLHRANTPYDWEDTAAS